MKLFVLLTILIFVGKTVVSQSFNQKIEIKNFRTDTLDDLHKTIGIGMRFDMEFKEPVNKKQNNICKVYVILKDKNDNIIFNDTNIFKNVYPVLRNNNTYVSKSIYFFIPVEQIKINEGHHNIKIELFAKNKDVDFGKVFSTTINYHKPVFYRYDEQEITIKNFTVKPSSKNRQKGVFINFDCFYRFPQQLIKENNTDKKYYFYVNIYDENNKIIYFPAGNIKSLYNTDYVGRNAISKEKKDNVSIFISNRKLNIHKGNHKLRIVLNATNNNKTVFFKEIADAETDIMQESFYIVNIQVPRLKVKYSTAYDVSNVFGRIFSKSSKNKGRGYPDVFWNIKTGYDNVYRSVVAHNSFSCNGKQAVFKIIDSDPVVLNVYDYDKVSRNDFIGSYTIKHPEGHFLFEKNNITTSSIECLDVKFSKQKLPEIFCGNVLTGTQKRNGVSYLKVAFEYYVQNLTGNMRLNLSPFLVDSCNMSYSVSFYHVKNKDSLLHNSNIIVDAGMKNGIFEVLIPYYELSDNSKVAFNTKLQNFDMQLSSIVFEKKIKIPNIKDIDYKIIDINETKYGGVYGVLFVSEFIVPDEYITNVGIDNLILDIDINSENIDLSKYIEKIAVAQSFYRKYFIPYYKLADIDKKQRINISYNAKIKDSRLNIGHDTGRFVLNKPVLKQVDIKKLIFQFKTKKPDYKKVRLCLLHHDTIVYEITSSTVYRKMMFNNFNDFIAHPNDDVILKIIVYDKFMQKQEIWTDKITALDIFNNTKELNFKSNKFVKKIKLY